MATTRLLSPSDRVDEGRADSSLRAYSQFTDTTLEIPSVGERQKSTMAGAILYIILLAVYTVLLLSCSWLLISVASLLPAILCSSNSFLLGVTGVLQKHLVEQVKKERRQGFLDFAEIIKPLAYLPFALMSSAFELIAKFEPRAIPYHGCATVCELCRQGTAAMLLSVVWCMGLHKSRALLLLLLQLVGMLEIICIGAAVGLYLWRVRGHNLSDIQPDALNLLYSAIPTPTQLGDLKYLDGVRLAEKQSRLLHFQQDNLRYLSEEVLRLRESLRKYERAPDGGVSQADLLHFLSAREQELRAVMVERDQLQSELRLARSLTAERDSDVLRIRTLNDKYVEENERLRAMLDEWSTRTAKLELSLEAERMTNVELHKKISAFRHSTADSK